VEKELSNQIAKQKMQLNIYASYCLTEHYRRMASMLLSTTMHTYPPSVAIHTIYTQETKNKEL